MVDSFDKLVGHLVLYPHIEGFTIMIDKSLKIVVAGLVPVDIVGVLEGPDFVLPMSLIDPVTNLLVVGVKLASTMQVGLNGK